MRMTRPTPPSFRRLRSVADSGCHTLVVASLHADHVAAVRPILLLLQAGALCLLLIGLVNLVNLLLIRASSRSRELAIRQALGAGRRHVILHVLVETMILAFAGAALGLLVGANGIQLLATFAADRLPLGAAIHFDARVAAIAVAGALVAGVLIGLPVAWFNLRRRFGGALQSESRGSTTSRAAQRLRHGFIVAQISLAFVLLTGAALLGISLKHAADVAPGFRTDHVLTGQFNLTWSGYHNVDSFHGFFDRLMEKVPAVPGVTAVGAISNVPVTGSQNSDVMTVPGHASAPGEAVVIHDFFGVAGDYFAAMGIPLRGRYLEATDARREEPGWSMKPRPTLLARGHCSRSRGVSRDRARKGDRPYTMSAWSVR